jgi:hypothetical protein
VCAVRSYKKKRDPTFFVVVVVSNDTYFFFNYSGLDLTLDTARDRLGVLPRKLILFQFSVFTVGLLIPRHPLTTALNKYGVR